MFHILKVEMFDLKALRRFISTKWKNLTGQLYAVPCPGSGYNNLENSTKFHVHEVEKLNWRTLRNSMSTKWKTPAGELYYISFPRS